MRCWFAPEDLKIGDRIRDRIDESIRLRDKLLLILSESSIESDWVEHEVESALEEERQSRRAVLFPIRLDNAVFECDKAWASLIRRTRHIGDFTGWKDHDSYRKGFERLLRDLKAESRAEAEGKTNSAVGAAGEVYIAVQLIPQFEEIKTNIILSTLAHVIAAELKRLKTFLHQHSFLLSRGDVSDFYATWIGPFEIEFEFGAVPNLKQAQYEQMKEQLANIDLRANPS